jgi:hypothetical protein
MSILLRAVAVAGFCAGPATAQWSTSNLSIERQRVGASASPTRFYFAGGCNHLGLSDVIDVYDSITSSWSQTTLSEPKDVVSVAASGDWVFFAGGRRPLGMSSPVVDVLHEPTGTWQQLTLPNAARHMGAEALDGKVYLFGGFNPTQGWLASVQVFDTVSWSWSVLQLPGTGRGHCSVSTDGRWLCSVDASPLNQIDVFDALTGSWRHTNAPANDSVGTVVAGRLYTVSCEGGIEYYRMSVLDLETFSWSVIRRPERRCNPYSEALGPFLVFMNGRDVLAPSWSVYDSADVFNTWSGEWRTMDLPPGMHFRGVAKSDAASKIMAGGGTPDGGLNYFSSAVDIFTVDLDIGQEYCGPAANNSTGRPARLLAVGVTSVGDNFMTLAAHDAPPGQVGLFLMGTLPASVPNPAGASGTLCVGGTFGRLISHVRTVNAAGILAATIDAQDLPLNPSRPAMPGETLRFQACFRDVGPLGPTVSFSDARAITFTP